MNIDKDDEIFIINEFFKKQNGEFELKDFLKFFKKISRKLTKEDAFQYLRDCQMVFPLQNESYVTKATAFEGRWFSFKPSREEAEKGEFILGHRAMPFINGFFPPYHCFVFSDDKILKSSVNSFSMNLALDVYAFFGEGYSISAILSDDANTKNLLVSSLEELPKSTELTCWAISDLKDGNLFEYGDRILCRVIDWFDAVIEMRVIKTTPQNNIISSDAIAREEWYGDFENSFLKIIDKYGPCNSIQEQLQYLFLEHQDSLCIHECGSSEEFLAHTKNISIVPYGVESRIWKSNEEITFIGNWNRKFSQILIPHEIAIAYANGIIDASVEAEVYKEEKTNNAYKFNLGNVIKIAFPLINFFSREEIDEIEKTILERYEFYKSSFSMFDNVKIADFRNHVLNFFRRLNCLIWECSINNLNLEKFPQQELIMLIQLYQHTTKLFSEFLDVEYREEIQIEPSMISLSNMELTFEDIEPILNEAVNSIKLSDYTIIEGKSEE